MSHHLLFNISDLICLLLDAQRHILRGDTKGADQLIATAALLLSKANKSG